MHEFKGEYKENNCHTVIGLSNSYIKEPYVLLNLEKFFLSNNLRSTTHCDLLFIYFKNNKYNILLIELKDIHTKGANLSSVLDSSAIINKFVQTRQAKEINDLLKSVLKVKNLKFSGVLVLPISDNERALLSHYSSILTIIKKTLKNKNFNEFWVAPCGKSIWQHAFP